MRVFRRIMLSGGIDIDTLPNTQKIYYKATAKVTPKSNSLGAPLIANKWNASTGEGVIVCSKDIEEIGNSAFESNNKLINITIPDSVISIGSSAFSGCRSLASVTIPDSVTSIGDWAFSGCDSLTSITIPDSVTSIGSYAFINTSSLRFNISNLTSWCSISRGPQSYNGNDSTLFLNNLEVTELIIPNDITKISDYSFSEFANIKNVIIPDNIEIIGTSAFQGCKNLDFVVIGNGVTTIESQAFYSSKIKGIQVGKNVKTLEDFAFNVQFYYISYFDFSEHDSVPLDISGDVFPENGSYKIIVPDALYDEWIATTNWSTYASHIIKKSDWDAQQATE